MRPSDQEWPFAFNVGKLVKDNLQAEMPASAIEEGALRARATFERINHRKRPSWRPWFISAATMGAAAAVLLWVVTRPITFVVKHGQQHAGGFVRSGAGQAAEVLFSDGTRLTIAAGGSGRVQDLGARGASVRLEGELSANVVHRRATRWRFDAGPFSIAVTGTAFDLRWSGDAQELDLTMRSGTVVVDGPLTPYLALRQGQHLQVRLRQGSVVIREQAPVPQTEPPEVLPPRTPLQPFGAAPRLKKPAQPSWTNFLAQGKFSSIVTEAEQAGVARALASRSLTEVAALADAARYLGHNELAVRALLTMRSRFSVSAQARDAAFLLGRLEQDARGDLRASLQWLDRYLTETPDGAFAQEALGRKLAVTVSLGRRDDAALAAKLYLARYPQGSYAAAAQRLLSP